MTNTQKEYQVFAMIDRRDGRGEMEYCRHTVTAFTAMAAVRQADVILQQNPDREGIRLSTVDHWSDGTCPGEKWNINHEDGRYSLELRGL